MKYYKIIITTDKLDYKFVDFVAVDNYRKLQKLKNDFLELIHNVLGYDIKHIAMTQVSLEEYTKNIIWR